MIVKENERIDDLGFKNLRIIQDEKEFRFGIDSVLLANFAKNIKVGSDIIDLGTGTGILSILLAASERTNNIIGIDIQEKMVEMAKRSVILNNLQEKIKIIYGDIKTIDKVLSDKKFDVVITNPPYIKDNSGLKNKNLGQTISRHEVKCTLEDIMKVSFNLLKEQGEFYMVHKPERIIDIVENMRKYKIEPKVLQLVFPNKEKGPNLILIKGIKNAKSFLKIERPIYIYNNKGEYTEEILKIYNKKMEG